MKKIIPALILSMLSACSSIPTRLAPVEKELKTGGSTTSQFHSILYYPSELSLKYDGYIIGVEKSPLDSVTVYGDVHIKPILDSGLSSNKASNKILDSKILYVSHIIKNYGEQGSTNNCEIYNAYKIKETPVMQLAQPCPIEITNTPATRTAIFKNSWLAMDNLKQSLSKRVQKKTYSHIVVIVMGWNTVQEESARNFNSIATNLARASGPNFNPLIIGVTWPSQWNSAWVEPIFRLFSFPAKAADADELGLTWLGVLLNETIPDANTNLPVVVIGHSFGSRASSVAACVGPVIYDSNPNRQRAKIDTLINLQGAFRSKRLFNQEDDAGFHYPNQCSNVSNVVLTASTYDQAVNKSFWGLYAGEEKSFLKNCPNTTSSKIKCAKVNEHGQITPVPNGISNSNITYIEASDLIKENAYQTGGGAHSDIYRPEHGVFMNNIINRNF